MLIVACSRYNLDIIDARCFSVGTDATAFLKIASRFWQFVKAAFEQETDNL